MAHPYWDKMTPEQRSAEMKRRRAKGGRKKKASGSAKRAGRPKLMTEGSKKFCSKCGTEVKDRAAFANHVRYHHPKRGRSAAREELSVNGSPQEDHREHVTYLYGKVETILEHYSHRSGVPYPTLAEGVAGLLRHQKGG